MRRLVFLIYEPNIALLHIEFYDEVNYANTTNQKILNSPKIFITL